MAGIEPFSSLRDVRPELLLDDVAEHDRTIVLLLAGTVDERHGAARGQTRSTSTR